jgi:hypothetical protein
MHSTLSVELNFHSSYYDVITLHNENVWDDTTAWSLPAGEMKSILSDSVFIIEGNIKKKSSLDFSFKALPNFGSNPAIPRIQGSGVFSVNIADIKSVNSDSNYFYFDVLCNTYPDSTPAGTLRLKVLITPLIK